VSVNRINIRRGLAVLVVFAAACGTTGPSTEPGLWTPFEDFWFEPLRADLRRADAGKVIEIAGYLSRNPDQQVGLDGAREPRNLELTQRRVASVRNALLKAGVPLYKIQSGYFSSSQPRRDSRVEVLISSR
jgi:outer membrane protein OmpA-like peptidoglycan-associated protein